MGTTTATALGITGCYTKTQASVILETGVDSGWLPSPTISGAIGRAESQEAISFRAGKSRSLISSAGIRAGSQ